jgi:thymidylate synthase (FAD)
MPLLEPTDLPQWYVDYATAKALQNVEADMSNMVFGDVAGGGQPFAPSRPKDDNRETNLLRDVAFNRHSMNDGKHVSPLDNGRLQVGTDGIIVKLVQGLDEEAFKRTLDMATRATIGMDLEQPIPGDWEPCEEFKTYWQSNPVHEFTFDGRDNPLSCGHTEHKKYGSINKPKYEGKVAGGEWEEMLKGGLQTALESQTIVFAVSGVSRTCTHQLVRSRRAAFHQQSQRASFYGVQPEVRMPESVWRNPRARRAALNAYAAAQEAYRVICEEDVSYQDARFVLPEGTTNYILCEYNVKEFRDVFAYRGCSMFSWEIVHVMREMRRLLVEAHPFLANSIKISCEKTSGAKDGLQRLGSERDPASDAHTCTFQGWERVEGQCDFPWARDSNRTFRSNLYEIGTFQQRDRFPATAEVTTIEGNHAPGPSHPAARALAEGEGPSVEEVIELGKESLRRHHPSLAAELEAEEEAARQPDHDPRVPFTDSEARRPDHYPGRGGW